MPKKRTPLDMARYNELQAQGLSQRQIAKALGMAESTLRENLRTQLAGTHEWNIGVPEAEKELQEDEGVPEVDIGIQDKVHQGIPDEVALSIPKVNLVEKEVNLGTPLQEMANSWSRMEKILNWFEEREKLAQQPQEKLERVTFHISPKWVGEIKREADLTGETYAAVVNRAFAKYFGGGEK